MPTERGRPRRSRFAATRAGLWLAAILMSGCAPTGGERLVVTSGQYRFSPGNQVACEAVATCGKVIAAIQQWSTATRQVVDSVTFHKVVATENGREVLLTNGGGFRSHLAVLTLTDGSRTAVIVTCGGIGNLPDDCRVAGND